MKICRRTLVSWVVVPRFYSFSLRGFVFVPWFLAGFVFRRFLEILAMGILLRDAWPTTELFLFQEVEVPARSAATVIAVQLLCDIGQGVFHGVLAV